MYNLAARTVLTISLVIFAQLIAPSTAIPTSGSALDGLFSHHTTRTVRHHNFIAKDNCAAKVENSAWQLTNIAVIKTSNPNGLGSSICFNFCDTNDRLEMETVCELTLTEATLAESPDGYFPCIRGDAATNDTVSFSVDWETFGSMKVERSYQDDCLGDPPYDRGNFFGSANLDLSEPIAIPQGQYLTQAEVQIYVTSQD